MARTYGWDGDRRITEVTDAQFLQWLARRLVDLYHEHPQEDIVIRLRDVANTVEDFELRLKALRDILDNQVERLKELDSLIAKSIVP
jgi:RNase P protein component